MKLFDDLPDLFYLGFYCPKAVQNYLCKGCGKRFNERTGTAMSMLRTPANVVSFALKMRTEGMGIRASGRVLEKSHTSIMRWEQKLANQSQQWSPPAPAGSDITVEGDEVYTRVGENLPPPVSQKDGQ
jgi:hypothetical protein